jgi:RNA polymerase sigma-70 factor (ECF subfamily)
VEQGFEMTRADDPGAEVLVARIAEENETALADLYARFGPNLLGMVSQMISDPRTVAAIVEEAFVDLWNRAPTFPIGDSCVALWLTLAARESALRHQRLKTATSSPNNERYWALIESFSWAPRPEEITRLEEKKELLRKVASQLPMPQREALDLVVFEGLSEEEIALRLGEPLAKVKSSLRAGLRFIRHRTRAVLGTWSANI